MKLLLLFLLIGTALVGAQNNDTNVTGGGSDGDESDAPARWGGCGADTKVKIGSPMLLCLHVAKGTDWSDGVDFIRLAFNPKADEYSRFHVPNSFRDLRRPSNNEDWATKNVTIGVGVQSQLSFLKLFAEGLDDSPKSEQNNLKIYPHLTAIIDVKDGVVLGITWDDACIFCGLGCDEITYDFNGVLQSRGSAEQPTGGCGNTYQECIQKHDNEASTDCDIVLYVVWTGTDVNGKAFLSSANRFSAFPAQELRARLARNLPGPIQDAANNQVNSNRDL